MSGPGGHGGGGWSPLHFRPPSPYGPSPPPRLGGPEMNVYGPRPPFMPCPRPRWPTPRPMTPSSPIPPGPKPFRMPMHPVSLNFPFKIYNFLISFFIPQPSPAPIRCASPDFYRGISPYIPCESGPVYRERVQTPYGQEVSGPREYEFVGVPLEPPPLPQNYEPEEEEQGPSTAEIIANQSQDYIDEKLAEYQATIYQLQGELLS